MYITGHNLEITVACKDLLDVSCKPSPTVLLLQTLAVLTLNRGLTSVVLVYFQHIVLDLVEANETLYVAVASATTYTGQHLLLHMRSTS